MLYKKCKFIFDYRSCFNEELEKEFPRSSLASFAWWVEKKLVKRADAVLTVNNIIADKIRQHYGRKAYVVPNYPPKSFLPIRNKWEIRGDVTKPIVLFIGKLAFYHDFANLLKCARRMRECEFWLIGDGSFKAWIQRHASSNVKLLGYIPHEEMPDYINACDVGIVPMKPFTETPILTDQDLLKVGELAALRKPIVASGVAPSSQYLLVKPDEMDKGIREALSGRVPIPIPHYWEDHSEKILFEVYSLLK
ncbi:MAG: glycosyltransferase, partial [Candidatus Hodarchaeota archaeon]